MTQSIREIMTRSTFSVSPKETLNGVNKMMEEKGVRHILVTDEKGKLLGIISDRDVKRFSSPFAGSKLETTQDKATLQLPVERFMTKEVITVSPSSSLKSCIELFLSKRLHALPVVDDEGIHGIVTTSDAMRAFLNYL